MILKDANYTYGLPHNSGKVTSVSYSGSIVVHLKIWLERKRGRSTRLDGVRVVFIEYRSRATNMG